MKTYTLILLALLLAQFHARAELRIIGVQVTRSPDSEVRVSIASHEAKEKKKDITVDEAAKILHNAKGWRSSVLVGVEAHGVPLRDYLPLLKAISENPWLDLSFVEGHKPDFINGNIRKSIEQISVGQAAAAPTLAFNKYLKAFAAADLKGMGMMYADEVTVIQGSTILTYGNLGGDDGGKKDKVIKRDALLDAYRQTITRLGGEAEWKERGKAMLAKDEVLLVDHKSEEEVFPGVTPQMILEKVKAKPGDVLAIVFPKGDSAIFLLRKVGDDWRVVSERWD